MTTTVGIDLGTTNSNLAFHDGQKVNVIEMQSGLRTLPSVVSIDGNSVLVGFPALQNADNEPDYTYASFKRLMGKPYSKMEDQGYQVVAHPETGDLVYKGPDDTFYRPEDLSAFILQTLVGMAEERLGFPIDQAVITVPAGFTGPERDATIRAGKEIGLTVNILNEPTAAALAYGVEQHKYANVAIYDLGGGTFDVAIMEMSRGNSKTLSTNGRANLGGKDFDKLLAQYAVRRLSLIHI